ncbi:hypothetical protein Golax_023070, partial [Gossypium laxum]|nr:hypothetical protein [Gossypium laxum]
RPCHGKGIFDKVEDNAAVRIWFKKTQEKGDSLTEGYMSELWDFTRINLAQYWNPAYSCFTFGKDLILAHLDTRKKVDVFVLSIYGYLSAYRRAGEERFIECAQLLLAWFHSHIWKSLQNEDIEWRSPWMIPDEILYRCEDFDWYRSRHFIPVMQVLARCEFAYKGDNCKKEARVAELERSQHQYRSRNSVIELKVNLTNIEELKGKIKELEATLQNCEL